MSGGRFAVVSREYLQVIYKLPDTLGSKLKESVSVLCSRGSSGRVRGGGPRNMKSMRLPLAAIFFMTYFHRARGGHGPLGPPLDPLLLWLCNGASSVLLLVPCVDVAMVVQTCWMKTQFEQPQGGKCKTLHIDMFKGGRFWEIWVLF